MIQTFEPSARKKTLYLLAMLGLLLACLALMWWLIPVGLGIPMRRTDVLRAIVPAVLALLMLLFIVQQVWNLVSSRRLRITTEGLELTYCDGSVAGRLPFEAIDKIELIRASEILPCVTIDVRETSSGWSWPGGRLVRWMNRVNPGSDVVLAPEWDAPLETVFTTIKTGLATFQDSRRDSSQPADNPLRDTSVPS